MQRMFRSCVAKALVALACTLSVSQVQGHDARLTKSCALLLNGAPSDAVPVPIPYHCRAEDDSSGLPPTGTAPPDAASKNSGRLPTVSAVRRSSHTYPRSLLNLWMKRLMDLRD